MIAAESLGNVRLPVTSNFQEYSLEVNDIPTNEPLGPLATALKLPPATGVPESITGKCIVGPTAGAPLKPNDATGSVKLPS